MAITESYAPSYYVWWFPGSPVKVHLLLDVVRRLREEFRFEDPKTTDEGLLFGKVSEGATEVLDFRSATGRVQEALSSLVEDESKQLLVGYYRIETGDTLRLNDEDLSLARTSFPKPYHVFLIIQPTGFGSPNASFFFHDGDGKMAEFSLMEFPFEPSLLAGEERDRLKRSQDAAIRRSAALRDATSPAWHQGVTQTISIANFNGAIVESASTTSSDTASRSPAPRQSGDHRRLVVASGSMLALLIFIIGIPATNHVLHGLWSRIRVSPGDQPSASTMSSTLVTGLSAKSEGTDVEITWNRKAPLVVAATSGVLSITDGSIKRDIAFNATQIRNSSVVYSPTSDRLSIKLSITTATGTVNESILLLLANYIPTKQVTLQIPGPSASRSLKPFTLPSPTGAATTDAGLLALPPIAPGPLPSPNMESVSALMAQPSIMPTSGGVNAPNGPVSGHLSPMPYHPAEPIHRVVPNFPSQLQAMITKPETIDVRIAIDRTGRVTKAEVNPNSGVHQLILDRLISAARSWKFKPARRGDEPVTSEFVIQFNFRR